MLHARTQREVPALLPPALLFPGALILQAMLHLMLLFGAEQGKGSAKEMLQVLGPPPAVPVSSAACTGFQTAGCSSWGKRRV